MNNLNLELNALCSMQLDDGSFSMQQLNFGDGQKIKGKTNALFSTCEVLLAIRSSLPKTVVKRALKFIESQKQANGHWNWDITFGIPDDADDTCCAIAVLNGANNIQLKDVSTCNKVITSYWDEKYKKFRTWQSNDVPWCNSDRFDVVVNCNSILAMRILRHSQLDYCVHYVQRMVDSTEMNRSRYYFSVFSVFYAAFRAGLNIKIERLEAHIKGQINTMNALELAQSLIVIQKYSSDKQLISNLTRRLWKFQEDDCTWPSCPWCDGENLLPWGSKAVTTAISIRALKPTIND